MRTSDKLDIGGFACRSERVRGREALGRCKGCDSAVSICASWAAECAPSACRDCQEGCARTLRKLKKVILYCNCGLGI